MKKYLFCWFLFFGLGVFAQEKKLIQFSGLILANDTSKGLVSFANIIRNDGRGTIADYQGYFSVVATENDTFNITAIGYKKQRVIIPSNLSEPKFTIALKLERDTVYIPMVYIYPWPGIEEFKEDFIKLKIPDDDLARAKKNLSGKAMQDVAAYIKMDGAANGKLYFQQEAAKLYYKGQLPPNQLLNPFAWAQFFQQVQNGQITFRNQKVDEDKQEETPSSQSEEEEEE